MKIGGSRHIQYHTIALISLLFILFVLIWIYLSVHTKKVEYYLFLYGDNLSSTEKVYAQVLSRDGLIVKNPVLKINGRFNAKNSMIDMHSGVESISVTVGDITVDYPLNYNEIKRSSRGERTFSQFTKKEIEENRNGSKIAKIGGRRVYVLPETFRMYPEYEIPVYFFCFKDETPCDEKVFINGNKTAFENGVVSGKITMPMKQTVVFEFENGDSGELLFPYKGRSFMIKKQNEKLFVSTLSDTKAINIDCFRNGIWQFTSSVPGRSKGVELPKSYLNCSRIQTSFNSVNPGTSYCVYTEGNFKKIKIVDDYYINLKRELSKHRSDLLDDFRKLYARSAFINLKPLYNGFEHEDTVMEGKHKTLSILWWSIAFVSAAGLLIFILFMRTRFLTAHDDEGELVTMSREKQYVTVILTTAVIMLFIVLLLYFLKNLA